MNLYPFHESEPSYRMTPAERQRMAVWLARHDADDRLFSRRILAMWIACAIVPTLFMVALR